MTEVPLRIVAGYRFGFMFSPKRLTYPLTIPCLKRNSKFLVDELVRVTFVF